VSDRNARRHGFQVLKDRLRRIFRRKPKSPWDPYADLLVRVRRGPRGRSGGLRRRRTRFVLSHVAPVSIAA
jgi:hypothetical protein